MFLSPGARDGRQQFPGVFVLRIAQTAAGAGFPRCPAATHCRMRARIAVCHELGEDTGSGVLRYCWPWSVREPSLAGVNTLTTLRIRRRLRPDPVQPLLSHRQPTRTLPKTKHETWAIWMCSWARSPAESSWPGRAASAAAGFEKRSASWEKARTWSPLHASAHRRRHSFSPRAIVEVKPARSWPWTAELRRA